MKDNNDNLVQTWQQILWREWYYCGDEDYAGRLRKLIGGGSVSLSTEGTLKELDRPSTMEVEAALRQACTVRPQARYGWDKRLSRLDHARSKSIPLEKLVAKLRAYHWLERFIACHLLVFYGGEATKPLQEFVQNGSPGLQTDALWILQSIGVETTERLAQEANQLLCPTCLVHCSPLEILLPQRPPIGYYGCRACGQSRAFRTWPDGVVAILDRDMTVERVEQNKQVRVNWLARRVLFDFGWIEIVQASDEDVERFAVQVGNDTDSFRDPRYDQMRCVVGPECQLSENTLRILQTMFGYVERLNEE